MLLFVLLLKRVSYGFRQFYGFFQLDDPVIQLLYFDLSNRCFVKQDIDVGAGQPALWHFETK
jgi:hypothetical protein